MGSQLLRPIIGLILFKLKKSLIVQMKLKPPRHTRNKKVISLQWQRRTNEGSPQKVKWPKNQASLTRELTIRDRAEEISCRQLRGFFSFPFTYSTLPWTERSTVSNQARVEIQLRIVFGTRRRHESFLSLSGADFNRTPLSHVVTKSHK